MLLHKYTSSNLTSTGYKKIINETLITICIFTNKFVILLQLIQVDFKFVFLWTDIFHINLSCHYF